MSETHIPLYTNQYLILGFRLNDKGEARYFAMEQTTSKEIFEDYSSIKKLSEAAEERGYTLVV